MPDEAEELAKLLLRSAQGDREAHTKAGKILEAWKAEAAAERKKKPETFVATKPDGTQVTTKINYRTGTISATFRKPKKAKKSKKR